MVYGEGGKEWARLGKYRVIQSTEKRTRYCGSTQYLVQSPVLLQQKHNSAYAES